MTDLFSIAEKENSKLLLKIKYLTVPFSLFNKLGLSGNHALIFAFIDSWLSDATDKFYFTNKQLSTIFNVSERTVSRIFCDLEKNNLIKLHYDVRDSGGELRFVTVKVGYKTILRRELKFEEDTVEEADAEEPKEVQQPVEKPTDAVTAVEKVSTGISKIKLSAVAASKKSIPSKKFNSVAKDIEPVVSIFNKHINKSIFAKGKRTVEVFREAIEVYKKAGWTVDDLNSAILNLVISDYFKEKLESKNGWFFRTPTGFFNSFTNYLTSITAQKYGQGSVSKPEISEAGRKAEEEENRRRISEGLGIVY